MEFWSYELILWTLGTPHGVYPGKNPRVHRTKTPCVTPTGNFAPKTQYFLKFPVQVTATTRLVAKTRVWRPKIRKISIFSKKKKMT